ncbi:PAS domain-containing sensor histidine kinase [Botryobacter ruber]|uniref:PAS domain-containing sensor histidine kinase n=1 Tax=Botryobacter ruber TaxID=2171629 RepID=UPI000E0BBBFB|nr:PAS domain-containing sensor histidine kinase [Botryobacter ruber]
MYLNYISLQEAIDLLPDTVVVVDSKGKIIASNKQIDKLFEYAPGELVGQNLNILIPERFREAHTRHLYTYFKNPVSRKMGKGMQLFGLRKSGEECDIDVALAPVMVKNKKYVIAAIRDVTELKELERNLLQKNEQLLVINSELERLGYIIAHDLKSPLLNIHAIIRLLKRELTTEQQQHLALHIQAIDQTLISMLNLITGITDYSKAAITEHKEEPVELNLVLKEACSLITFPPNASVDIPEHLPVITGNKTKLLQVFLNLISNAVKYNDKEETKIAVRCLEKKNEVLITISDNGPGVPRELRRSIFNLFQKGDIQKENSQGIGLAVVKKIIEERGGSIIVDDSPLGGADFIFSWPLEEAQETKINKNNTRQTPLDHNN